MAGTHGLPRSAADGSQRLRLDRRRFDEARYSFERIALTAESVSAFVDPKRIFDFPHQRTPRLSSHSMNQMRAAPATIYGVASWSASVMTHRRNL